MNQTQETFQTAQKFEQKLNFRIFKNTLIYCRNVMVEYMKRIEIKEIELCALFGMFLWQEGI